MILPLSPDPDMTEQELTQLQENAQRISMKALSLEELKHELEQAQDK